MGPRSITDHTHVQIERDEELEEWAGIVSTIERRVDLVLAYFIQVPRLRRLIGLRSDSDPRWPDLARRQRYISYVLAGRGGPIGFLMSTKPVLW